MGENRTQSGVIELRVEQLSLLFDALDPFPIPARDLSKRAETFILDWARELPRAAPIQIIIHTSEHEARGPDAGLVSEAVKAHFKNNVAVVSGDLKDLLRVGRFSLLIGLVVLSACIASASALRGSLGDTPTTQLVSEGLIILGWVANWRPIEIFLYDWWPLVRRRRLHQRLAGAAVEFREL